MKAGYTPTSKPKMLQDPQHSLRDVMYMIFRHKWKILAIFLLIAIPMTLISLMTPEVYQTEAKILVKAREEALSPDPVISETIVGGGDNIYQLMHFETSILNSQYLAEQVVSEVIRKHGVEAILGTSKERSGLAAAWTSFKSTIKGWLGENRNMPREHLAVKVLQNQLTVDSKENVITLSYVSRSPQNAQSILDTVVDVYMDRHVDLLTPAVSPEFFDEQRETVRLELLEKENELKNLQQLHQVDSLHDQKNMLIEQITAFKLALAEANGNINAARAKSQYLEEGIREKSAGQKNRTASTRPVTARTSPTLELLQENLVRLQIQKQEMANRYQSGSRHITMLEEQIGTTQAQVDEELKRLAKLPDDAVQLGTTINLVQTPELMLQETQAELAEYRAQALQLQQELQSAQEQLKELNALDFEYGRITRQIEELNTAYTAYSDNWKKAQVAGAIKAKGISNLSILQAPYVPMEPAQTLKERYRNIILGIFGGLFAALILAFLLEYFDHSFRTNSDVERHLHLPVLASIPSQDYQSFSQEQR
jgi:uncharacterized protein involved in exopolysaccharide biosynthesis